MSLFHLWKFHSMALIAGCILDWLMGDPYWLFHPVRFMGNMISALEARLRRLFPEHLLLAGGVLAGFMCLFWTLIPVLGFWGYTEVFCPLAFRDTGSISACLFWKAFFADSFWRREAYRLRA